MQKNDLETEQKQRICAMNVNTILVIMYVTLIVVDAMAEVNTFR